ncbi:multidrug effflux MFS transporter [Legionella dresdenensis]|uniref:Multidrug effflux MFS transporter n=1 Tax=Legionella dresdenensis TaxID=450200 RepID=A0ABV8CB19_9GAMM
MVNNKIQVFYIGFLSAFSLIVFDLYQPALPAITNYFHTTHAAAQLTLNLFFFVFGISQLIWGPLIDHYGRVRILNYSLYLFTFATLVCVFATSIEILIIARTLQGFTVCCANIVAFSSSRDISDAVERAQRLSFISMIVSVSPIISPLIGSIIFINFGWRATFIFMILIGFVLFWLSSINLEESPFWKKKEHHVSIIQSLMDYRVILSHKKLWRYIAIISFSYSCIMITVTNASFIIIDNLHRDPLTYAVIFASNGVTMVLGNYLGIYLRTKRPMIWNIHFGSATLLFSATLMLALFYFYGLTLLTLAPVLIINLGICFTNAPSLSLALSEYTDNAGTATAILNMSRMVFASIISAISGITIAYSPLYLPWFYFLCALACFLIAYGRGTENK